MYDLDKLYDMLIQRSSKCFPTAPLHSEGTDVGGFNGVSLYVGWELKELSGLTKAWRAFRKSDKSELPNMVPDFKKFMANMEMLADDDSDDGDSEPNGTGIFAHYLKLKQELDLRDKNETKKYLHIFQSEEVVGENAGSGNIIKYEYIIVGIKLGDKKDGWTFTREALKEAVDAATNEMIAKFPTYDPSEIRVMIGADYASGNVY